ncbi:MAG: hypothetical protein K6E33_01785, partial [Lachnospiraceae bacterium]|nr:hypothetical protein [Lachnospiraceae bacterium]
IKHRFEALVSACLSFVPLIYFLYGGNLSEEWSLPFIYAGLYIYLQYFTGKRREIRALDVAAEGVLCGLVLMIRVNGACVFAVFSVVLLIWLLLKKDISGAVKCIVSFFAGVLASFLPFAIWYASKGALKEMWEVYISFNMYYSELHGGFSPGNVISLSVYFITRDPMLWLPFVTLLPVILLEKKDYWRFIFYLFMGVSCLCAAMGGQPHVHYAMYLIPCLTVPIACTLSALLHFASKKGGNIGAIALRCVIIFVCVAYLRWDPPVGEQRHVFSRLKTIASEDQRMLDHIAQNTEPGDDILVTGLNARIYYASGHLCGSRRFIQHFMYDYDGALMKEMLDYVDTDSPRLIILPLRNVDGDPWGEWMTAFDSELRKRMSEGHFVRYSDDVFVAYRSVED